MINSLTALFSKKTKMATDGDFLLGREEAMAISNLHYVNGHPLQEPFPEYMEKIIFGLGCFWGAEKKFWQRQGVYTTAVGYSAGHTKNPRYEEVCTGYTGHNEVVLVVFDPDLIDFRSLLALFWESHNPTQGMRQGNDTGTQYRSGIYYFNDEQKQLAEESKASYQAKLEDAGYDPITTEILKAGEFFYAEEYHQQYLAKNPSGYCGLGGLGIACENE